MVNNREEAIAAFSLTLDVPMEIRSQEDGFSRHHPDIERNTPLNDNIELIVYVKCDCSYDQVLYKLLCVIPSTEPMMADEKCVPAGLALQTRQDGDHKVEDDDDLSDAEGYKRYFIQFAWMTESQLIAFDPCRASTRSRCFIITTPPRKRDSATVPSNVHWMSGYLTLLLKFLFLEISVIGNA
jgi:hypothetical protein